MIGLVGQFSWTIENMYLNVYLYNTVSQNTVYIATMVALSAVTATLTTPHIPRSIYIGYIATTAFICLIMLITGCKKIIFRQNDRFLDIILYLCTLEILPIAVSVKAIHELNILITINC